MKDFLKYTLATITGIILVTIFFFVLMLGSLSVMVASGNKPVSINENSVLVLKAGMQIPDRGDQNPLSGLDPLSMTFSPATGLNDILKNIEKAASDPKIKGILIENGILAPGWATTEEIRNALLKFRESGKFVIAWADYVMLQEGYYLSTAAEKIYLNPGTMMDFKGLSGEVMFYKKALEKIGVDVQVIRHGRFKGAVEPFLLDDLSPENEEQIKDYVGSIWQHVVSNISRARNIGEDELNVMADNLVAYVAQGALENRLVDGLLYRDQLEDSLKVLSGIESSRKLSLVSMTKYSRVPESVKKTPAKDRIAVIFAEGNIVTGKGGNYNIGGNHYAEIIRKERLDSGVKAIVLRVNSPGGNAVASDIMWRELELAAAEKPLVISMGNYAASGGYFISAPATKIYSNPTTITGSIGVFGLVPNTGTLLNQKLGINTATVKTNSSSDFPSVTRQLSSREKDVMQMSIEHVYSDFVSKVASGRQMSPQAVDSIGEGRVYSGSRGLQIGLVDEIGGLTEAIKGAAELAQLESYTVRELPMPADPYTQLLSQLTGDIKIKILQNEFGAAARMIKEMTEIQGLTGIQARLPYFIEIR